MNPRSSGSIHDLVWLHTEVTSEEALLNRFHRSCFGENHIVHLDPFAFVVSREHAPDRERYAKLLRTADRCVASKSLAAPQHLHRLGAATLK